MWLEGFVWNSRREGTEVSRLYSPKSHHHLIKIQLPLVLKRMFHAALAKVGSEDFNPVTFVL